MKKYSYHALPALFMGIHIYHLLLVLLPNLSLIISIMLAVGTFIFYKIKVGNVPFSLLIIIIQTFILSLYFLLEPSLVYFIPLAIFLLIEAMRIKVERELLHKDNLLRQYERERENFNETFRVVRTERHDFLKHIAAIQFLLENRQWSEARTYLADLVDGYEETNLSIKGERGVVAGILHQMYKKGKKAGIEMIYDIELPISSLPLADTHIVALMGNLLTNSVDAAAEWQKNTEKNASITLQFFKRSGLYILTCENNCLPLPTFIVDKLFSSYGHTTKGEGHDGLGTKVIAEIVEKNHGFLDFTHKDEKFSIKIKFPAIH